jgi:hypothetical protein
VDGSEELRLVSRTRRILSASSGSPDNGVHILGGGGDR